MLRSILFPAAGLLCAFTLLAQDGPRRQPGAAPESQTIPKEDGQYTLSVDVRLVTLPVSVQDGNGNAIPNLQKEHFQVFEDDVQQEITLFRHEDIPVSLGLVIDNSGSMRNKRERVNAAALSFVKQSNQEDETFIINFDDQAYLEQDFTGSLGDLVDALDNIDTRGETALHDAIYLAVDKVKEGRMDKKALLIVSDGEDNKSKYGYNKVLEHVRAARDVTIYAIGLLEPNDDRGGLFRASPSKKAKEALTELAKLTGGQAFFPESLDEIDDICTKIAHDLRNQYTLGYTPKRAMDGGWREIEVKVNPPRRVNKLTIRTKEGYMATPD